MRKLIFLFILFLSVPCYADSEVTVDGARAEGHIIQDEGTTRTQRPYLNFTGDGVSCTDSGGKTVCVMDGGLANMSGDATSDTASQVYLSDTLDLGNRTSFEIPNGATPTVNAFGEIAGDNNMWASGRGAVVFYDGTASTNLVGALTSDTPSNGQVPKWNTGGTITWEADNNTSGITITQYQVAFAASEDTVAGDAGMTYDPDTNVLTVTGGVNAGASTGVTMTGSNGTVTFLGAGDGQDEEIKLDLNSTADTVVLSSTKGTNKIDFNLFGADFDSSTLKIPASASQTMTAAGGFAIDTTDDQIKYYGAAQRVIPYKREKCIIIENLAAADDNFPAGSFLDETTVTSSWCTCHGTCTTKAAFSLEDGSGNAFTMATPTCVNVGTTPTAAVVTTDTVSARESMRFDVTNAVSPETDEYELCVSYTTDAQ